MFNFLTRSCRTIKSSLIERVRKFCDDLGIKKDFGKVYHPQYNVQIKVVIKIIKHTLKIKRKAKKIGLKNSLWSNGLKTPLQGQHRENFPFMLSYGCEAMILVEIGVGLF